jgi:hypothetical protein
MLYHSTKDEPSLDINMVELLLRNGTDPNQPVHPNGGKTVWASYLLMKHEPLRRGTIWADISWDDAAYQACRKLIQAGARSDCFVGTNFEFLNPSSIFDHVFEYEKAALLVQEMDERERETQQSNSSCVTM